MAKTIYFIGNWKMNGNYDSIKEIETVNNFLKKSLFQNQKKLYFVLLLIY